MSKCIEIMSFMVLKRSRIGERGHRIHFSYQNEFTTSKISTLNDSMIAHVP
jgi:hypothetical protein